MHKVVRYIVYAAILIMPGFVGAAPSVWTLEGITFAHGNFQAVKLPTIRHKESNQVSRSLQQQQVVVSSRKIKLEDCTPEFSIMYLRYKLINK